MALSTVIKNFRDGSLTMSDGTGTPISITVQFDAGDFTISGLKAKLAETAAYETRGTLNSVRHTTRTYPSGSFSAQVADLSEATTGTVADAILRNGAFSAAVSTLGANAECYCLNLVFVQEGTDHGDSGDATFTLANAECSIDFTEGDPNSFSISFVVYGAVTGDLATTG